MDLILNFATSCNRKEHAMNSQSKDFKFFVDNHEELFRQYPNKVLVIQDGKVVMARDNFDEAISDAVASGLGLGTFIIQECTEGDSAYTQTFHSRVIFA